MAYIDHNYTNPGWSNDAPPPINSSNLNDISNALEALNITQQEAENIGGTISMSLGEMLQQMNADTINKFAPYTTDYKWERYSQTVGISQSNEENGVNIQPTTNTTIQYCTSFKAVNGTVQMNNPTSITYPTTTTIPANVYVYAPASNGYIKTSGQQTIQQSSGSTRYFQVYGRLCNVQVVKNNRTFVTSSNTSAYPANGYRDSFYYKKITTDSMWNYIPEIVTYVGTGASSSSNPITINFKTRPKAIRWLNNYGQSNYSTIYGISIYNSQYYGAWLNVSDMTTTWKDFVTYWNNSANVGIHARINGNSVQLYVDSNAGATALSFAQGIWNVLAIY